MSASTPATRCTPALEQTADRLASLRSAWSALLRADLGPVTVAEFAERLEVGVGTILRWEAEGYLPGADKIGDLLVWDRTVVNVWLRAEGAE